MLGQESDRVMTALSLVDNKIRANLLGETVEKTTPDDKTAAKDLVKAALTNFNRNEFMAGIYALKDFHKKMAGIAKSIAEFKMVDVGGIHSKFLFQGGKHGDKELEAYREYMKELEKSKEASAKLEMIKEAGIVDSLLNVLTPRGRALSTWNKMYPKKTKALKEGGIQLSEAAQDLLNNTLGHLKEMATYRATRSPDAYMEIANQIIAQFSKFDKAYRAYHKNIVEPCIREKDAIEAKERADKEKAAEQAKAEQTQTTSPTSSTAPTTPLPPAQWPPVQTPVPAAGNPPPAQADWPFGTQNKPVVLPPKELKKVIDPETGEVKMAHQSFYASLQTMSQEDPRILAGYIAKYAQSIQSSDLETSIKLLGLVKSIRG
jgi:hypothetical protein